MKKSISISICATLLSLSLDGFAQLAITEAMSSAANTFTDAGVTNSVTQNSDFWELTNFGTDAMDLTDYKMADEGAGFGGAYSTPFDGLIIGPGETILFVQDSVNTTAQSVRDWWGEGLSNSVRIVFYHNYGLSAQGDGMSLWDPNGVLVDHAHVDAAVQGQSFTYDPVTGAFGILSSNGVGGAFRAATTDDIGSPGLTTGPAPLLITQQPTNFTIVTGGSATFAVAAQGLPHPKFQWRLNGTPIDGATASTLVIASAQINDAGTYSVLVTNGVETALSSNAVLTVNPAPTPPTVLTAPKDLVAYIGQAATFSGTAQGNPTPTYQWKFNDVIIPGATTTLLSVGGLTTNDSGVYTLAIANSGGTTNVSATLLVTRRPNLVITEVQSSESNGPAASGDWFELSNLDDFAVDVFGYRWDDNSANLGVAYVITNHAVLQPGESIVLVETSAPGAMTADKFKLWWGETNLPPNLQIIVYGGNGLGLSSASDQVNVWNQAATADADPIGKVAAVQISTAAAGRTFIRNPDTGIFSGNTTTGLSTNGLNGAFTAASNGDIGSPGWVVEPMRLQISQTAGGFDLTWNSTAGRSYTIYFKNLVTDPAWAPLTNVAAVAASTTITDSPASPRRVYRLAVTVH